MKITIELEKDNLKFFKREAAKHKTSYQRMIRNLLKEYVKMMK